MDIVSALSARRSVREYTGEEIPPELLEKVIKAGLLAPSGRNLKPWEFVVIKDKNMLKALSRCREFGASMLLKAGAAVIVLADGDKTDVWTEDASIAMAYMHLAADSLGLGSCWIQGRRRQAEDGSTTEDYIRALIGAPSNMRLEAILSLGIPEKHPAPHSPDELPVNKVHYESF
ncbi:MAG: nitroreductase family protein [Oscillospiraceae bacterium]|nr:nitroreductase family protein [Oscillospiraceae bacterium]